MPTLASSAWAASRWPASQRLPGDTALMPASTRAGVLGITRTTATSSGAPAAASPVSSETVVTPATSDTTRLPGARCPATSASSAATSCGLTTSTTVPDSATAVALSTTRTP